MQAQESAVTRLIAAGTNYALSQHYQELADRSRDHKELMALRQEFDGETRITADNQEYIEYDAPKLSDYRDKAKRTRDSLPARFYRMVTGEEWDGQAHSYSLARKERVLGCAH